MAPAGTGRPVRRRGGISIPDRDGDHGSGSCAAGSGRKTSGSVIRAVAHVHLV
ncbi:hypothetical protein Ae168Ps1_2879c [Pseudonocardia sp. Ae168_Ps1]|nr:hypothetical protein Ae150APs1_2871c [Pseudonocardia sp. Ae150A_Ps1]OLL80473.1 hypothetical protein Ae168Ps1_2879c [Pseudonocardia sp. Ae168_Ps1]OLL85400.1 hypothetical protein Ae263Ps1_2455 [Pseudonocardia sp. Ae263_Ps1]OLL94573.1 hypothetical protein Ae356Ps1_4470c [Pseudonocardia sp. Ae356_Ps1]